MCVLSRKIFVMLLFMSNAEKDEDLGGTLCMYSGLVIISIKILDVVYRSVWVGRADGIAFSRTTYLIAPTN
jgi:hypothetical protein